MYVFLFSVMPVSQAVLDDLNIPQQFRDFCVDKYVQLYKCGQRNFPVPFQCDHEYHAYHNCKADE